MAILSDAASGQYLACEDAWTDVMILRCQRDGVPYDGVQEQDIRNTIYALYEKAGALGSKWPENKDNKAISKHAEQQKAYSKSKEKEKMTAQQIAAAEDMGEDAVEAAYPRVRDRYVDELAGRFGKVAVPDKQMVDSDGDDDEVRVPGKRRRT
jgi:hypothetical protein